MNQFANKRSFDVLVVFNTMLGVNPDFVVESLGAISMLHFITTVHPLPGVDWKQLAKKMQQKTTEELRFKGVKYNVRLESPVTADSTGQRILARQATLRTFVVDREVMDVLVSKAPRHDDDRHLFWCPVAQNNKFRDESSNMMHMWGREVWVDVERPTVGFELQMFGGCIGYHHQKGR